MMIDAKASAVLTPQSGTEDMPAWGPPKEIKFWTYFHVQRSNKLESVMEMATMLINITKIKVVLTGGAPSQNSTTARPIKLPY